MFEKYFPILVWIKHYTYDDFASDTVAAIVVTIMLIPQSLAYALLAGLPPQIGLYASIIPLLIYSIFGTSNTLAVGPVAVIALMTFAVCSKFAQPGSSEFVSIAILLARLGRKNDVLGGTFLGGVFCILVGFIACFYGGFGFQISLYDFVLLIFMGSFTIGIGIMLVTWGTPFVPTSEVCLLVLLESVLGSIWPWIFLSEQMTFMEIIGSCLILFSIIIFSLMNKRSG